MENCNEELGEFDVGYCLPDELADPFFEPDIDHADSEMSAIPKFDRCVNAVHYG